MLQAELSDCLSSFFFPQFLPTMTKKAGFPLFFFMYSLEQHLPPYPGTRSTNAVTNDMQGSLLDFGVTQKTSLSTTQKKSERKENYNNVQINLENGPRPFLELIQSRSLIVFSFTRFDFRASCLWLSLKK